MTRASAFLKLSPQEIVTHEWEVLDDTGHFGFDDLLAVFFGLLFFILPGLIFLAAAVTRPARRGYFCLTNWRCLYYERGEGTFRNYHFVYSLDLGDIVGVHSVYEEGLFGTKSLLITLSTKHDDGITVRIGDRGVWLSRIPLIGKLFRRNSIGRDATKVPPILFTLIEDGRADVADSQVSF